MSPSSAGTEQRARAAAASESAQWLVRGGWAAKGIVYGIIGVLALQVATGTSDEAADHQGALSQVADKPFGTWLLVLLAVGLAAYALGRLADATVLGADTETPNRVGYLVSATVYAALAVSAVRLLVSDEQESGSGSGSSGDPSGFTAELLDAPLGRWLVGALGLAVIAAGAVWAYRGAKRTFMEQLDTGRMSQPDRRLADVLGPVGIVARGAVTAVAGWFLVRAAVQYDAEEAVGLDGALRELAEQAWGTWLLVAAALGLLAYALYCLAIEARFHRVG